MSNALKPNVTVITVCRNCAFDIRKTIESVICQDYPNLEYIIIDGASTDGTIEIINEYKKRVSRIISEPDRGVYDAMNKGLRFASGDWINFMNAGDKFTCSNVISRLFADVRLTDKVIYGDTLFRNGDGSISTHNTATLQEFSRILKLYQPYVHQSAFFNISEKSDCYFDTRYRICADYDVSVRYYLKYGIQRYSYKNLFVTEYKAFDGISYNFRLLERECIKIRFRRRFGIIQALYAIIRRIILTILCSKK